MKPDRNTRSYPQQLLRMMFIRTAEFDERRSPCLFEYPQFRRLRLSFFAQTAAP